MLYLDSYLFTLCIVIQSMSLWILKHCFKTNPRGLIKIILFSIFIFSEIPLSHRQLLPPFSANRLWLRQKSRITSATNWNECDVDDSSSATKCRRSSVTLRRRRWSEVRFLLKPSSWWTRARCTKRREMRRTNCWRRTNRRIGSRRLQLKSLSSLSNRWLWSAKECARYIQIVSQFYSSISFRSILKINYSSLVAPLLFLLVENLNRVVLRQTV